jgi:hypothetical protein
MHRFTLLARKMPLWTWLQKATAARQAMRAVCTLMLGLAVALPQAVFAKSVSSPADLGPSDYWAYIEATKGALARAESRDSQPVSVVLPDPTIGGIGVTGLLSATNDVGVTGPGTLVNAQIKYDGALAFDTDIDLRSLVTFDLAAFGPAGPAADVRIVGGAAGGVFGNFFGQFGKASATRQGYVTVYETDANGNPSTIVKTYDGCCTGPSFTDVLTLNRNELYKVIVRSIVDISLFNVDQVDLTAYMFMDPRFSSETPGVQAIVSQGAAPVPLPPTVWLAGMGLLTIGVRVRMYGPRGRPRSALRP